jgi:hypothetical protein
VSFGEYWIIIASARKNLAGLRPYPEEVTASTTVCSSIERITGVNDGTADIIKMRKAR